MKWAIVKKKIHSKPSINLSIGFKRGDGRMTEFIKIFAGTPIGFAIGVYIGKRWKNDRQRDYKGF
jgi:hypothetical protein